MAKMYREKDGTWSEGYLDENGMQHRGKNPNRGKPNRGKPDFWQQDATFMHAVWMFLGLVVILFSLPLLGGIGTSTSTSPSTGSHVSGDALKYEGRKRLKAQLRDPGSLEIISERLIRPGRNGKPVGYSARYRARNGFGGMTVDTFYTE